ncbi:MAG: type II secretion system minor pseudopilin GspH [Woeseiaceae bacterium]|jgi:general secretion pathway protein H|nr:type II secretion system minor pseudopilin GspH [Woeseiaceae bacterium]
MHGPQRQSGFTLFEILVVVLIIGIIAGTAVLSVGVLRDDRQVRREADRAAALISILQDEAMLQGREFGIEFTRTGYRFVEYDPFGDRWAEIPLDDLLRARQLPESMEIELYLDGQSVKLDDTPARFVTDEDDDRARGIELYSPHVFVYSSGDLTPFEVHIIRPTDNARVALAIDVLGNQEFLAEEDF